MLLTGTGSAAPSSLLTSLVAYYALESTAGTDATGRGNTLTATNSPTTTTGKVGNGASLVAASSQYYTIADNADLSMGDIDFTIAGWVNATTLPAAATLFGKWNSTGGVGTPKEYWVGTLTTSVNFFVSSDGSAQTSKASAATLSTSTWYFVVCWHDSVNNTINIQVNNGTPDSAAYSSGVFDGVSPFRIGAMAGNVNFENGIIDEVGVWKRVLTAGERTSLYNAGAGITYPFVGT